jgi:peptide maturation system protein (TIGR04066 family)
MRKVVIFPYHPDIKVLISYKNSLADYQLVGFMSYKEDARLVRPLNEAVGSRDMSDEQLLRDCDTVILLDNYRDYRKDMYYRVIQDAIGQNKEVLLTPLAETQLDMSDYQGRYNLLELLPEDWDVSVSSYDRSKIAKLHEVDTPIIGVLGQGKHCDKFENQLLLKDILDADYKTVAITSNSLGALFGCYTIPSFMYERRSFEEKVILYNQYIWELSKSNKPDVFILGVPEGIAPFARLEFHHFAEYPLIISAAVSIDFAIFCTYFMSGFKPEYLQKTVIDYCIVRFGIPIGAIAVSRTLFEISQEELKGIIFEFLEKPYLRQHYPSMKHTGFPMIDMVDHAQARMAIQEALSTLQGNVKAI